MEVGSFYKMISNIIKNCFVGSFWVYFLSPKCTESIAIKISSSRSKFEAQMIFSQSGDDCPVILCLLIPQPHVNNFVKLLKGKTWEMSALRNDGRIDPNLRFAKIWARSQSEEEKIAFRKSLTLRPGGRFSSF